MKEGLCKCSRFAPCFGTMIGCFWTSGTLHNHNTIPFTFLLHTHTDSVKNFQLCLIITKICLNSRQCLQSLLCTKISTAKGKLGIKYCVIARDNVLTFIVIIMHTRIHAKDLNGMARRNLDYSLLRQLLRSGDRI